MSAKSAHEHVCERPVQRLSLYNFCPRPDSRQPAVPCQELKRQCLVGPLWRTTYCMLALSKTQPDSAAAFPFAKHKANSNTSER